MRRLSITRLIELKEKHEFAQDLLTLIAKNNQFWTSLSKASYKAMTHDIFVENKTENNIGERSMETPLFGTCVQRVKKLVSGDLVNHRNDEGKTALEVFSESHKEMVEDGKRQLTNTARSACAALVSAVTFAAGFSIASDQEKKVKTGGTIYDKAAFDIFSHSYMVGLSFGAMALVQFMSLLMSSFTEQDFRRAIPTQYFLAIISLFLAMLSMLVAFACNTYVSIYGGSRPNWKTITPMVCEITIFPLICLAILSYQGVRFRLFSIFKSLMR